MALNFPANTSLPYIDPVSGLKYIYNDAVNAWEAAIQPPAVISATAPDINIPGFLWWDDVSGTLYIWYQDENSSQWVEAVPTPNDIRNVGITLNPPSDPQQGDLWWNVTSGRLYIYYVDPSQFAAGLPGQWIDASPNTGGEGGGGGGINLGNAVYSGTVPPVGAKPNDLWWSTTNGNLFIYYDDGNTEQWVICQNFALGADSADPSVGRIEGIVASAPLRTTGLPTKPSLSIDVATTVAPGVVRLADANDALVAADKNAALTPGILKESISAYLDLASETGAGVVELATKAEVTAGTDNTKAVSPNSLKQALPTMGMAVPVGSVITFAGKTAPAGYLICDGSSVGKTAYPDLFSAIGTTYGFGEFAYEFKLPDLRGEFIRGFDGGRGVDTNRSFGSAQSDDIKNHTHAGNSGPATSSTSDLKGGAFRSSDQGSYNTGEFPGSDSTETRPRNVAMLYCIKF